MTTSRRQDPRPGFEEHQPPHRRGLSRGDLIFGLGVGVVLAVVLVALMPDLRTHMFGGTFKRSGPPRRDVGDTWDLWVSPDGSVVESESPLITWLWLGLGIPAISLLIGLMWQWRQRVLARSIVRGVEKREARLARRAGRRAGP